MPYISYLPHPSPSNIALHCGSGSTHTLFPSLCIARSLSQERPYVLPTLPPPAAVLLTSLRPVPKDPLRFVAFFTYAASSSPGGYTTGYSGGQCDVRMRSTISIFYSLASYRSLRTLIVQGDARQTKGEMHAPLLHVATHPLDGLKKPIPQL